MSALALLAASSVVHLHLPGPPPCARPIFARRPPPPLLCAAESADGEVRSPSGPLAVFVAATGFSLATLACHFGATSRPALTLAQLGGSAVLPTRVLLGMRVLFASIIALSLHSSLSDKVPHTFTLMLYPQSKLKPKAVPFKGIERLTTFTVQCWALQLVYFVLAAAASAAHLCGLAASLPAADVMQRLFRAVHVLFDVSATTAILVTSVVTFVLIPARIKRGDRQGLARMLGWRPQCMHNLNLIFVVSEMLFASLPVVASHFVFPALFGIRYVLIAGGGCSGRASPMSFLDPTLPPARRSVSMRFVSSARVVLWPSRRSATAAA